MLGLSVDIIFLEECPAEVESPELEMGGQPGPFGTGDHASPSWVLPGLEAGQL